EPPGAGELFGLRKPAGARAREHPHGPVEEVVARRADERRIAVGRQRHAVTEFAVAQLFGAGELRALLAPGDAGAGEHPGRPETAVVRPAADERGLTVRGQRDAATEVTMAFLVAGLELRALLAPGDAGASEHPDRPVVAAIAGRTDQRRLAVGGQRHASAEVALADAPFARELRALLFPARARMREHPSRPVTAFVGRAADQRRVAVGGQRHAAAEVAFARLFAWIREHVALRPRRA